MNRQEIEQILPHRKSMLLLDELKVLEGNCVYGSYYTKGDEFFFDGHFPGKPIVPGVILCEIMAQTSCGHFNGSLLSHIPLLIGIKDCRFRNMVEPRQKIEVYSYLIQGKGIFKETHCVLKRDEQIIADGNLSFFIQ